MYPDRKTAEALLTEDRAAQPRPVGQTTAHK